MLIGLKLLFTSTDARAGLLHKMKINNAARMVERDTLGPKVLT
jgi:hypothetical protein